MVVIKEIKCNKRTITDSKGKKKKIESKNCSISIAKRDELNGEVVIFNIAEYNGLMKDIDDKDKEIATLNETIKNFESDRDEHQKTKDTVADLKGKIDKNKGIISEKEYQLSNLTKKLKRNDETILDINNQIVELNNIITDLKTDNKQLKNDITYFDERNGKLQVSNTDLSKEIKTLKSDNKNLQEANEKITPLENEKTNLKIENVKLEVKNKHLKGEYEKIETIYNQQHNELRQDLGLLNNKYEKSIKNNARLNQLLIHIANLSFFELILRRHKPIINENLEKIDNDNRDIVTYVPEKR